MNAHVGAGTELLAGADKGRRQLATPDAEVATPLYPHQQEALAWMIERENSSQLPPFWGALHAAARVQGIMRAVI